VRFILKSPCCGDLDAISLPNPSRRQLFHASNDRAMWIALRYIAVAGSGFQPGIDSP
jgi:hypothetical protein